MHPANARWFDPTAGGHYTVDVPKFHASEIGGTTPVLSGSVTEAAAFVVIDPAGMEVSRQQTASAVFPEGPIGQSFYGWLLVGRTALSSFSLIEPVSTGFSTSGEPVETGSNHRKEEGPLATANRQYNGRPISPPLAGKPPEGD